jgi:hypothetical protein
VLIVALIFLFITSCGGNKTMEMSIQEGIKPPIYNVKKLEEKPLPINANWNKPQWEKVEPLTLKNYMGNKPEHFPKTQARVLYDDENIYVIFRVKDRFVRAVAKGCHGDVWKDSCVEFFFTPALNIERGYFNLETNCGGTILFRYQPAPRKNRQFIKEEDCKEIEIAHSLPEIIEPEIKDSITWTLEYRLPLKVLQKYCEIEKPSPGVIWRANFYKCGDNTSHPHWLTWSFVANETPNFHLPQYFGTLKFVE